MTAGGIGIHEDPDRTLEDVLRDERGEVDLVAMERAKRAARIDALGERYAGSGVTLAPERRRQPVRVAGSPAPPPPASLSPLIVQPPEPPPEPLPVGSPAAAVLKRIVAEAARVVGAEVEDVLSGSRYRVACESRHLAAYACRWWYGLTYGEIAPAIGYIDRSSARNGVLALSERRRREAEFDARVLRMAARLGVDGSLRAEEAAEVDLAEVPVRTRRANECEAAVRAYFAAPPAATWREVYANVPSPYTSANALSEAMRTRFKSRPVPGRLRSRHAILAGKGAA